VASWARVGGFVEELGRGDAVESLVGESGTMDGGVRGSEKADVGRFGWVWTAVDILCGWATVVIEARGGDERITNYKAIIG